MKKLYLFFILVFTFQKIAPAQTPEYQFNDSGEIPFEMVKNTIIIPVKIEGKAYRFILDTGGVLMISKNLQRKYQFSEIEKTTISDINKIEVDFTTVLVPEIEIGLWTFTNKKAVISLLSDIYPVHCFETDGIIGRDFFNGALLHFDYARKVIRLTNKEYVLGLDAKNRTKLRLSKRGLPDVLLRINGKEKYIEFDSGSGDFFSFKSKDAKKVRSKDKSQKLVFEGAFSFGVSQATYHSTTRYKIKVDEFNIGAAQFSNFYSDFSKPTAPRIGASILYYGKVTVDYKNNWFYFSPYQNNPIKKGFDTFGFDIAKRNDEYIVKWILKGSQAEKTGLAIGIKIIKINDRLIADVANGCEGYLYGYSFKKMDRLKVDYINSEGVLETAYLEKEIFR